MQQTQRAALITHCPATMLSMTDFHPVLPAFPVEIPVAFFAFLYVLT